ncbi:metallophosphoesterase [bacterium]|nr:metallophosphoesterase [candidate division CSSED10-310 bacterium]
MRRFGVLSDTHIPERASQLPEMIHAIFQGCEKVFHAGDITHPRVIETLQAWGHDVIAVRGNMDYETATANYPEQRIIRINDTVVAMIHGWGSPLNLQTRIFERFEEAKPNVIIFGHTHQAKVEVWKDILWINPGSPTDRIIAPFRSVAILEIDGENRNAMIVRL